MPQIISAVIHDSKHETKPPQLNSNPDASTISSRLGWSFGITPKGPDALVYASADSGVCCLGNPTLNGACPADLGREILAQYQRSGSSFLNGLAGSFALIVRDAHSNKTLLASDKIGAHQLFIGKFARGWLVSSSLPTLLEHSDLDQTLNYQALYHYLHFHVIPGPITAFNSVERLQPGTFVEIDSDRLEHGRYWQLAYSHETDRSNLPSAEAEFHRLLRTATISALEGANRPGCFLSGGTDSSTVSGVVKEVSGVARTYSIGFEAEGYDEMAFARTAAKHFGTEHHEYYVTPDDVVEAIPKIAKAYGQPFGNSSAVPTYFCARMAKSDGIDRLLGGDGGDELFGGNIRYGKQNLLSYYDQVPQVLRDYLVEPVFASRLGNHGLFRKVQRYIEQAKAPLPDRLEAYNYLNVLGHNEVLHPNFLSQIDASGPMARVREVFDSVGTKSLVNRMLALDYQFTLADNDLPKVGVMSNLAGVDARYPLLDDTLVAFAAAMPVRYKVKGTKLRIFFKDALRDFLPREIIVKSKQGFGLPFGPWLKTHQQLRELVFDSLIALKSREIIRPEFIDSLIDDRLGEHAHYYGGLIWVLMMLEQWMSHHASRASNAGAFNRSIATKQGTFARDA